MVCKVKALAMLDFIASKRLVKVFKYKQQLFLQERHAAANRRNDVPRTTFEPLGGIISANCG